MKQTQHKKKKKKLGVIYILTIYIYMDGRGSSHIYSDLFSREEESTYNNINRSSVQMDVVYIYEPGHAKRSPAAPPIAFLPNNSVVKGPVYSTRK